MHSETFCETVYYDEQRVPGHVCDQLKRSVAHHDLCAHSLRLRRTVFEVYMA